MIVLEIIQKLNPLIALRIMFQGLENGRYPRFLIRDNLL